MWQVLCAQQYQESIWLGGAVVEVNTVEPNTHPVSVNTTVQYEQPMHLC